MNTVIIFCVVFVLLSDRKGADLDLGLAWAVQCPKGGNIPLSIAWTSYLYHFPTYPSHTSKPENYLSV
jgi:hypothetical protein